MDSFRNDITSATFTLANATESNWKTLFPSVYEQLKKIASNYMYREREDHTLQATALVHEAYMKFDSMRNVAWEDRSHFFRIAARVMRQVLVDHARSKHSQKRGKGIHHASLDTLTHEVVDQSESDILLLNSALERLHMQNERQAALVELRYFIGLSLEDAANMLAISIATAKRDWAFARAWLFRELREDV